MPTYHNKTGASNKFWEYDVTGTTVNIKWGRVGGSSQSQTKEFPSQYRLQAFIDKKVGEKIKKGYEEVTTAELEKETTLAETLGFHWKIQELDFAQTFDASRPGTIKINKLGEYDPDEYIFIELLHSWNKSTRHFLISKKLGHKELRKQSANIYRVHDMYDQSIADGVLTYLEDIIDKFTQIVTASFGSLGTRALDSDSLQAAVDTFKGEQQTDMSDNVLGKLASISAQGGFGSLGGRALDL